jgi:phage terminase large subunit
MSESLRFESMPQTSTTETYKPCKMQAKFHADPHTCRLIGGARGPGKSRAGLEEAIRVCTMDDTGAYRKDAKGINALILRTSLTDLEGSIISKFRESPWFIQKLCKYNEQKKLVTFPNGATLLFGYAACTKDLRRYLGSEYAFIFWDELGLVPDWRMFISLMGCLRCPIKGVKCRIAGSANPGGPGHAWLKAMFIDKRPAPGMEPHQYVPSDYSYIPGTYLDGPYKDDKEYLAKLKAQPSAIQKAWIDGDWNIVAGAYFNNWNLPTMTFPWTELHREDWWKVWISIDWGFKHHCAIYWHCIDDNGFVKTFKELVIGNAENQGSKWIAQRIADASSGLHISTIYLSPDAKQRRDADAHPIVEQMGAIFTANGLPYPVIATDDRSAGWLLMYQLLNSREWKISDACKEAIAAIPSLMINPDKMEDVLKTNSIADDVADALRYGILSHLQGRKAHKPDNVAKDEHLRAMPSIQARYMADLHWQERREKELRKRQMIGRIGSWQERMGAKRI